ncbi:MAG: hypothetical protein RIG62_18955 [Cyclobacteriaceae bacterium]
MNALDFVFELGNACIKKPEIYFQAGHNGPYYHPETPLRNKGHWLITLANLYEWSGENSYLSQVEKLATDLLATKYRPFQYSFFHRDVKGKDRCNGLMGQAWTIEALAKAADTLQDTKYSKLAAEVFLQTPFNEELGLWNVLEVDGTVKPIDNAFNHQLWMAAAASFIMQLDPLIAERVHIFLDKIWDSVTVLESGLIYHELENITQDSFITVIESNNLFSIKQTAALILQKLKLKNKPLSPEERKKIQWEKMLMKSIGYHSFNTYAFALLHANVGTHPIWKQSRFRKIIDFLFTNEYAKGIENNRYSFSYNPPGYEIPYSLFSFEDDDQSNIQCSQLYLQQQIDNCYNPSSKLMDKNNEDPFTLTARVYELSRLASHKLEKIQIKI